MVDAQRSGYPALGVWCGIGEMGIREVELLAGQFDFAIVVRELGCGIACQAFYRRGASAETGTL